MFPLFWLDRFINISLHGMFQLRLLMSNKKQSAMSENGENELHL